MLKNERMPKKIMLLFAMINILIAPAIIMGFIGAAIFENYSNGYGMSLFLVCILLGVLSGVFLTHKTYSLLVRQN